jgi:hypothetical protein
MKYTKTPILRPTLRGLVLALAAFALSSFVASAHPYASAITNASGTISFTLNEGGAAVVVSFPQNSSSTNLGTLAAGRHSFILGAGTNNYTITVTKTGTGQISQISSDSTALNTYLYAHSPRGVAVNHNPNDHNFGRIYISDANASARGLYVINADQSDALGYGTTAKAGSIPFVSSSYSPYRLYVGPDDTVFVASCSTVTAGGFLGYMNPDLTAGNLALTGAYASYTAGDNHTIIMGTPVALGSISTANLSITAMDGLYTASPATGLSILQWSIGSGPYPSSVTPAVLAVSGLGAFQTTSDNFMTPTNFYMMVDRSSGGGGFPILQVFTNTSSPPSTAIWDSLSQSLVPSFDVFNNALGMSVSPDGQLLGILHGSDASIQLMYLTNAIPNLGTLFTNTQAGGGGSYGSLCFDAAENLYCVCSGPSVLRIFSLGLSTTCITANDATTTNGTFQLIIPSTQVSVTAPTNVASQNYGNPLAGEFTITRVGNLNYQLTVPITFGGTATNGVNYYVTPGYVTNGSITLAAGAASTNITITPINGGSLPTLSVVLSVGGSLNYSTVLPGNATVTIANTGPQLIFVSGVVAPSMYLALSNDFASFNLTRWGDTNVNTVASSFTYPAGATAVAGTDYTVPVAPTFAPGDVTHTVTINPLVSGVVPSHAPHPYVGNKTAIIGYTGSSSNAVMTIIDDADPPATVLFSDPLTSTLTGGNPYPTSVSDGYGSWNITWGGDNMGVNAGPDYDVEFGYDLTSSPSANGLIPFPPNGSQYALRVTCNKSLGNASGVNIYPTNVTFSGNYAIRFNANFVECGNVSSGTEGPLFGMNHAGIYTNWWSGSGVPSRPNNDATFNWEADGIWCWMDDDPGGATEGDYVFYSGNTGSLPNTGWEYLLNDVFGPTFGNNFKIPVPYTAAPSVTGDSGVPANQSPLYGSPSIPPNTWSDVELKQVNNVVTFSINKTPIFTYTNTTSFTNGTLMLGYNDPFDSLGSSDGAAYISNLRVVQLGPLAITSITTGSGNVVITFVSTDGDDTTASFALQSASVANAHPADVSPAATFTQLASGAFQVTYPQASSVQQYYRIRHK